MKVKKFLDYFLSYFRRIYIFESKKNSNILTFKNFKLKKYSSLRQIKNNELIRFIKKQKKTYRFKLKQKLLVLFYKKVFVCSGWIYEGSFWKITEINQQIEIKGKILLFDFFTLPKYRNKGFYSKILLLIKNIRTNKIFLIYCLKNNTASKIGILNSKFRLIKQI